MTRHALGRVCVALAPLAAALADGVEWRELGPAPLGSGDQYTGRVSAVACSPTDGNVYFIGAADGGVWRTVDGGITWTPLSDRMPTSAIGALAIDPTNPDVVYAGTGEANYANHSRYGLGIYKSVDGGDNWSQIAPDVFAGRTFAKLVIDPTDSSVLYAAIGRAGGFPALAAAKLHPQANGPVGVFRSDDGGVSWVHLTNGIPAEPATDLALDPQNPTVVYAAIGNIFGSAGNGIYKSVDGGQSWSKLGGGLPTAQVGRISLAVAPTQTNRLYALVTRQADANGGNASTLGAWRSDTGGASWTSIPVGTDLQATYGWYLSCVSVHPSNANTVIMGGLELRRSTNSGSGWSTITPPHVDMHAIAWDASGRLVVGDDGGVHRSSDLGASWTALNAGLGVVQFYAGLSTHPTDPDIFLGGTQDNGSNRRTTDSLFWTQVFGGDGGWTETDQASPNRLFVEYQGTGNLYRSLNSGQSFQWSSSGISASDRNCFLPPYQIAPDNSNRMLYGTHRVYRSTNGGTSWAAISGDLTNGSGAIRTLAIAPSDSQVVYAATNDGNLKVSVNGGSTFTSIGSGLPGWPRVTRELFVDPQDALTVYHGIAAFGQAARVRVSRDAGQNWESLTGNLPDLPVNSVAADRRGSKETLFAGTDAGLYRSVDTGQNWHRYGLDLPRTPVIDIRLETPRSRIVIATQGRGAWTAPIAIPGDMNGDASVNGQDIMAFILAITEPDAYAQQYPTMDAIVSGDLNGDASINFFDVEPFISLLGG